MPLPNNHRQPRRAAPRLISYRVRLVMSDDPQYGKRLDRMLRRTEKAIRRSKVLLRKTSAIIKESRRLASRMEIYPIENSWDPPRRFH
jgi:hypothetical protein